MITIDKKEFLNGLTIGGAMAGKAKTMPILENAKCVLKGNSLIVSSYDCDTDITKRVHIVANDGEDFAFCVKPKDVIATIKSISDKEITFEVVNDTLTIYHKRGEMQFPVCNTTEFPAPVTTDMGSFVSLSSNEVYNTLKEAALFISDDMVRQTMCGVYVKVADNTITFAATNGQKLYVNTVPCEYNEPPMEGILKNPTTALSIINGTEKVSISIGERNFYLKTFDATLIMRRIEGKYPNYQAVIPKTHEIELEMPCTDLVESVRRVAIASDSSSNLLRLGVNGVTLTLSSEDVMANKRAKETHLCSVSGNAEILIGANVNTLADCLSCVENDYVILRFIDATKPIIIKDGLNDTKIILVMPMRIQ